MAPKRVKAGKVTPEPPPAAVRRYVELIDAQREHVAQQRQQQQQQPKRPPAKDARGTPLDHALRLASERVHKSLMDAGILEHLAVLTGRTEDADAYAKALVAVDSAYADLWACEAFGVRLRIHEVEAARAALLASSKPSTPVSSLDARMDGHRQLALLRPTPDVAVEVFGIPLAPSRQEGGATAALRRRLAIVARTSDGPMSVRVLRGPKLST